MPPHPSPGDAGRTTRLGLWLLLALVVIAAIALTWMGMRIRSLDQQLAAQRAAPADAGLQERGSAPSVGDDSTLAALIGDFAHRNDVDRDMAERLLDLCVRYGCGVMDQNAPSQEAEAFRQDLRKLLPEKTAQVFFEEIALRETGDPTQERASGKVPPDSEGIFSFEDVCPHWQTTSYPPTLDQTRFLVTIRKQCGFLEDVRTPWQQPEKIVTAMGIEPGDTVADIGSASGYFTDYFSEAVGPAGKVYAVDIDDVGLGFLAGRIWEGALPHGNVELVLSTPTHVSIPEASLDSALVSGVHFHMDPDEVSEGCIRSIFRALKPGGKLAVIEGASSVPLDVILAEYLPHGFTLESKYNFLVDNKAIRPTGHPDEHCIVLLRP